MIVYFLVLLAAVVVTARTAYSRGITEGEARAHSESMGNYLAGLEKGRKEGFKAGEEKGRREGYDDGRRYAMSVQYNKQILIAEGILNADGEEEEENRN